jgi:23S rRNA (guanosine2251-2'-O)-methyltransferase
MKQRGRNRPFWDKGGGGRPGERAARETIARESPGERAARAFEEKDARRKPPGRARDADERDEPRRPKEEARHPRSDPRRQREEPRRQSEESRRRPEEFRPRHGDSRRREESGRGEEPRRQEEARRPPEGRRHRPEDPRPRREDSRPREEFRPPERPRDGQRPEEDEKDAHAREGEGALLFGVQPVLEALRAGQRPVERLTVAEGAHEARLQEILELARAARVPVRRAPRAELQRLADGANHQGVVALVAAARYFDAEELLEALAARVGTKEPPLALVLDGVEDPRNLGAIIRTAECAGAHGLFVPERRAAGLTETAAKAAAGALEYVPVARATNLVRLIEELKALGVWTIGTAADARVSYTEWDWTQPCALVLGGEGEGLRRLVRERCDALVSIPLRGHIASLNVSVAAGVLLYEALRQRQKQ